VKVLGSWVRTRVMFVLFFSLDEVAMRWHCGSASKNAGFFAALRMTG
jgi:hypothetical protein